MPIRTAKKKKSQNLSCHQNNKWQSSNEDSCSGDKFISSYFLLSIETKRNPNEIQAAKKKNKYIAGVLNYYLFYTKQSLGFRQTLGDTCAYTSNLFNKLGTGLSYIQ